MRKVRLIVNSRAGSKSGLPTNRTSVEDVIQAVQRCSLTDDIHVTDSEQGRMTITLDRGEYTSRAFMVSVANGPYTGIGFTVAPNAELGDVLFDVRVFRRFSRVELILRLGSIAFGRRRFSPRVDTFRSRPVTIRAVSQLPARADAYALSTTPITFEYLPGPLRVIAPLPAGTEPAG